MFLLLEYGKTLFEAEERRVQRSCFVRYSSYQRLNSPVIPRQSTSVPEGARAGHRRKIRCVKMLEREDRAKPPSLSLKRRKQSTKAKISALEIARSKGYTKEAKCDSADEISRRENCYCPTQCL